MTASLEHDPAQIIEAALVDAEIDYEKLGDGYFAAVLPGTRRLQTTCHLKVGGHSLQISAFVMRHPDENHEQLWAYLLQQNARTYGVSWSTDQVGDVYLTGRVALAAISEHEVDRILGTVLDLADSHFNQMLEIGFASSIRREWEWRVKRGESLANLEAFTGLIERMTLDEPRGMNGVDLPPS